jgi:hypothetical protein
MSILCIEEYERGDSGVQITNQNVTVSGTSAQSSALNAATTNIVLTSDVDVYWAQGASPTASSSTAYLPAFMPRRFIVEAGEKIAVISK